MSCRNQNYHQKTDANVSGINDPLNTNEKIGDMGDKIARFILEEGNMLKTNMEGAACSSQGVEQVQIIWNQKNKIMKLKARNHTQIPSRGVTR